MVRVPLYAQKAMSSEKLDLSDLGKLVAAERKRRGWSLRETARAVDVPFNTLARVEKGHVPDLPKFKRLVEWSGADINSFFELREKPEDTTELIASHLQADRNLSPEAAERITGIVKDLYRALASPQQIVAVHLRSAKTFHPEAARKLAAIINDLNQALIEESDHGPTKGI